MPVQLNHTLVAATDQASVGPVPGRHARPPRPDPYGPFICVETENGASLDFMEVDDEHVHAQHYAFLVSDEDFDATSGRIEARGLDHWADPHKQHRARSTTATVVAGVYFDDPGGHLLEALTVPYGGW